MLGIIVITLFIATSLNVMFKLLNLPTIIGYITTGTIIGYGLNLSNVVNSHQIQEVAEFGVVFLMFTIGLEFSLAHLKSMKKEVFIYGTLQVIITTTIIAVISNYFLGTGIKTGIIIGAALSLASTAIILKLFNETGETNTTYGKNIVGILIFQDLAVIPMLLMISIFATGTSENISSLLTQTVLGAFLLLGIMWLVGKYFLNYFFKYTMQTKSQEVFLGAVLFIVFASSYIAHYFGFSYSLGAFIAGMLIAETHYKHQVEADLIPFRELLLGFFFITVGMQLNFSDIWNNIDIIIIILPIIIVIKFIIISLIVIKQRTHNIIKTGLALLGLGEFGLVIVSLAKTNNLLDTNKTQILNAIIIISLFFTPLILRNLHAMMNFINIKIFKKENKNTPEYFSTLSNHIILIGFGRLGHYIATELKNRNQEYIIVEGNQAKFEYGIKDNEPIILGNGTQQNILEMINISKARSVFISVGNSRKVVNICNSVRTMNENIKMIVKVNTNEEKKMLENEFLHDISVIVETEETAKIMLTAAKNMLATNHD
jgi:CPA2 family monovalent cation:H+ antiporter-2